MNATELRAKSQQELEQEILSLRKEQFNLRMQQASGQLTKPHEYVRVRKDIARVKTIMGELKRKSD
jgi:large subunit ribosomal protein L29